MSDANPNQRIAVIKISKGGTSLSSHWKAPSGYMFATFTNMARVALTGLTNLGHTYTVCGMIWHQGESDSTGTALASYETNMIDLILAIRSNLGVANLPFVIGELATNKPVELRTIQSNLAQNIPYVGFASADALTTFDGTHFDSASVLVLGQRFAQSLEVPPLQFTDARIQGANFHFTATGLGKTFCRLLSSTDVNPPVDQWSALSTNQFDATGQVEFVRPISGEGTAVFYQLVSD